MLFYFVSRILEYIRYIKKKKVIVYVLKYTRTNVFVRLVLFPIIPNV